MKKFIVLLVVTMFLFNTIGMETQADNVSQIIGGNNTVIFVVVP